MDYRKSNIMYQMSDDIRQLWNTVPLKQRNNYLLWFQYQVMMTRCRISLKCRASAQSVIWMITWLFSFKSRPFRIKLLISMLLLLNKICLEFWFWHYFVVCSPSNCHPLCELPSYGRVPKKRVNGVCMQATMAYGNMEVQLQSFLTWTFSAGHWSSSQLQPLYCLGKSLQYPFNNRMSGHSSSEHFGEVTYTALWTSSQQISHCPDYAIFTHFSVVEQKEDTGKQIYGMVVTNWKLHNHMFWGQQIQMQVQLRTRQICAALILDLTTLKNIQPFTIISTTHVPLNVKSER